MKNLKDYIYEVQNTQYKYFPKNLEELRELVRNRIRTEGKNCDLNDIDTSKITDMTALFSYVEFNGDVSKWDVSNVEKMNHMFSYARFNADISKWNVSNVKEMYEMFLFSKFNGDISNWDVSNVENMAGMFEGSEFNQDISNWNVSNVKNKSNMFKNSPLKNNPPKWFKTRTKTIKQSNKLKISELFEICGINDFDDYRLKQVRKYLKNWIKNNDVKNVSITFYDLSDFGSLDEMEENYPNYSMEEKEYKDYENDKENLKEGPGFNSEYRDDIRWNDESFGTGSDASYYVILYKV